MKHASYYMKGVTRCGSTSTDCQLPVKVFLLLNGEGIPIRACRRHARQWIKDWKEKLGEEWIIKEGTEVIDVMSGNVLVCLDTKVPFNYSGICERCKKMVTTVFAHITAPFQFEQLCFICHENARNQEETENG